MLMDLAYLAFFSLAGHPTLLHMPYSRMLLGTLVMIFLISHWLRRYRTSYMAISIYYFLLVFNLKGILHS